MLTLGAATLLAYLPALRAGFIWDDQAHVTAPALRSLAGLWHIWFNLGATQQYYPLLHSTFWLENQLWGQAPLGYHLANLLLHLVAALLFARLLQRLAVPGARLAALLFALHPVHTETVAWVSEQKNTLSLVLYLCAALAWLGFDATRRPRAYALASGWFLLALLTKTVTATLPAALLVLAWWRRGRIEWRRDVVPLLPWFAIAAVGGLFTAWVERKLIGAEGAAYDFSAAQRLLLSGRVVWFYLGKLLWPAQLTFFYPRWTIDASRLAQWLPLLAALAWTALLAWRARRGRRGLLAAWLLFAGSLFPVLGFFNVFPFLYSFVADHFQYLASLAVFATAGAAVATWLPRSRAMIGIVGAAGLVALACLTHTQARFYRSNETLFRVTLARNPTCWAAANNLGRELMENPATRAEGIALFQRALSLRHPYAEANNNLGLALSNDGRSEEALPYLQEALRIQPTSHQAHNNLGIALARLGRGEEALAAFQRAAELSPTSASIEENWAKVLVMLGREAEAQQHFAVAARLRQLMSAPPPRKNK